MHVTSANRISRRYFLQVGAGAVSLTSLPGFLQAEETKGDFGGFTVGVQSYCFRQFDTEGALKRTHDLGLHFMEFFQKHAPLTSRPEQTKALLRLCHEYEITPIAYGVQGFPRTTTAANGSSTSARRSASRLSARIPIPTALTASTSS